MGRAEIILDEREWPFGGQITGEVKITGPCAYEGLHVELLRDRTDFLSEIFPTGDYRLPPPTGWSVGSDLWLGEPVTLEAGADARHAFFISLPRELGQWMLRAYTVVPERRLSLQDLSLPVFLENRMVSTERRIAVASPPRGKPRVEPLTGPEVSSESTHRTSIARAGAAVPALSFATRELPAGFRPLRQPVRLVPAVVGVVSALGFASGIGVAFLGAPLGAPLALCGIVGMAVATLGGSRHGSDGYRIEHEQRADDPPHLGCRVIFTRARTGVQARCALVTKREGSFSAVRLHPRSADERVLEGELPLPSEILRDEEHRSWRLEVTLTPLEGSSWTDVIPLVVRAV